MTHDEMNELYELYALGALEPEAAAEIEEHIRSRCAYCLQHLQEAMVVAGAMCGIAEEQKPPARLRRRVIDSVKLEPRSRNWLLAVVGLSAACAALLIAAVLSTYSAHSYRMQIGGLEAERDQLQEAIAILSKSDTRTVQFGQANNPHGRVFVNKNHGLVFVGSELPELASKRTFQLWLIPAAGTPESAGLFRPNPEHNFVRVWTTPIDTARIRAIAVSVEPSGGSPAPTTKPVLVVPLG